jgi:SAM-dependent methyltransferase
MPESGNKVNVYSELWYEVFADKIPQSQTQREVEFINSVAPVDLFPKLVDVCCGNGRHSQALSQLGYKVVGIDRNHSQIERLQGSESDNLLFCEMDMLDISKLSTVFDVGIIMWQSFGYFDRRTNVRTLEVLHTVIRNRGRLVLDIYNRSFFEGKNGVSNFDRDGMKIIETKKLEDKVLSVRLDYINQNNTDEFNWTVYNVQEIQELAVATGFKMLSSCTDFNVSSPITSQKPRMQLVFEAF